jgi:hypothetical protein
MTNNFKRKTEKLLFDKLSKQSLDKRAIKGLLWKNIAKRIGD